MNTVASTTRGQGAASTNRACATKPWRAGGQARAQAGRLLAPDFLAQQQADDQIAANQRREGPAPAHRVREQAAGELAGGHAEDGAGQETRQRLPALIRNGVADPGHGQRHDAGPGRARQARHSTSISSDWAMTAPALPSAQAKVATLTTRYLP